MANQLCTLIDGPSRLDLTMNFKKSKIILFGPGSYMKTEWRIDNSDGTKIQFIEEVGKYKNLGVIFGKGRSSSKHTNQLKKYIPFRIACLKAKACSSTDRRLAARVLWKWQYHHCRAIIHQYIRNHSEPGRPMDSEN